MKITKKPKVNVAFKEGYDMGYSHAKKEVLEVIDEITKMFEPHNFTALKDYNKELKARINGK